MPDGRTVELGVLSNGIIEVAAISLGGIITSIRAPDRRGMRDDVVLGASDLEGYLKQSAYLGAIVGRYANRIARGHLPVDGRDYQLTTNDRGHHLHGGSRGFNHHLWALRETQSPARVGLTFFRRSSAGEEGYPGNVDVEVSYELSEDGDITLTYAAFSDAVTVLNLSQHTYFNLTGFNVTARKAASILGHELVLEADRYVPVDNGLIPLGTLASVENTPFDFRVPTAVGARIDQRDEQLAHGGGYDHTWVVRRASDGLARAAALHDPVSGRTLEVWTTEPGVQFYSGNQLDGSIVGGNGQPYERHAGLCLETQHFPDSPHQPAFPSTVLVPGERFFSQTIWRFRVA